MANALYPRGKAAILRGDIDVLGDTLRMVLIDSADYTYSATHEFLSDIPSGARVGTSTPLTSKTIDADTAALLSDDAVFAAVVGDEIEAFALYQDTGSAATSRLILFQDTGVTGLPLTPDGSDVRVLMNTDGWFGL